MQTRNTFHALQSCKTSTAIQQPSYSRLLLVAGAKALSASPRERDRGGGLGRWVSAAMGQGLGVWLLCSGRLVS